MDVIEMDAASRTGIGDIREVIESVRFLPVSARYKVYIIDEVHMLSNAAFNGLLKTLEEPPPHVKFIFATTEIRKVPITVLSRCQRFDLKRIDGPTLVNYLKEIAGREGAEVEDAGLGLIARASEGSVRDGLSLLDQAIALGAGASVNETQVREMLGLADRSRIIDLFDHIMAGKAAEALEELRAQYDEGADPVVILNDILEYTHWLTRLKIAKSAVEDVTVSEDERKRGEDMASRLPINVLSRTWQLLLKGIDEVRRAPQTISAAEMVVVRLCYAADLPTPDDLIKQIKSGQVAVPSAPATGGGGSASGISSSGGGSTVSQLPQQTHAQAQTATKMVSSGVQLNSFDDVIRLAGEKRDIRLKTALTDRVHLVSFARGRIDLRLSPRANSGLTKELAGKLKEWTGEQWFVSQSKEQGAPTARSVELAAREKMWDEARNDVLVKKALEVFPEAKIISVEDRAEETLLDQPPLEDDGQDEDLDLF